MHSIQIRSRMSIAFGALFTFLMCARSDAVDSLGLQIARVQQAGISVSGIDVQLRMPNAHEMPAIIHVAEARLPQIGVLRDIVIQCPKPIARDLLYRCDAARISLQSQRFGKQNFVASVSWNDHSHRLAFEARGLRVADGGLTLQGEWTQRQWSVKIDAARLGLASLQKLFGTALQAPAGWSVEGTLAKLSAQATGAQAPASVDASVELTKVAVGNADGTIATDQLAAQLELKARRAPKAWRVDAELRSAQGEALAGRWYWNFTQQPLISSWHGEWRDDGVLALEQAHWRLGAFMRATAAGEIGTASKPLLRSVDVSVESLDMAALPPQTRDGLLAGSPVAQLQGSGRLSGGVEIQNDAPIAVDLSLDALTLNDSSAKLAIDGLSGHLLWHTLDRRKQVLAADGNDTQSELSWKSGLLYGVAIGGSRLRFTTASADWRLLEATRIPILDGGLDVRVLQLRRIGDPAMSIRFDATVNPISIGLLSKAFGWPEFAGTLSGRIPDLTLESGVLTLGGALQAAVFNGALTVKDLQLSDAFGARPRLTANVGFTRLDLAAITSAFSVGRITGHLDGRIEGLELVGWEPVAFDARLYSTPGDHSRRRISQRAVQNISSIGGGGGAAAALQRSALRFFNEFNYDRLGLSCRLRNDVCEMDGVEDHPPGYYLVKGWGLPRIDVIGNSRRVDWPRLVTTLKELPESQASIGESP
jgi:hypothetical protein